MMSQDNFSRRSFLAFAAATPLLSAAARGKSVPIGIELYSVRDELSKDLMGTVRTVGKMGYQCVEFYSPYYDWTPEKAKEVRSLLDEIGVKCYSTHNGPQSFTPGGIAKAVELNHILGSKYIVLASAGNPKTLDGWKKVAATLNQGAEEFGKSGMQAGYHNHQTEFIPIEGKRPMEVLAAETGKNVMLQLDVGTCLEAGSDPVAWINQNPGRIRCLHCKDWAPENGYKVLFGEGKADWKKIFAAAEDKGGVEYYLIEQEGSRFTPFETAEKCLATIRSIRSA
jgi:sugar phosphate isomerase/epimerase